MFQELFDAATTESILKLDHTSGSLAIRCASDAIIREVGIISQILLCWYIWEPAKELMEIILSGLAVLVRKDHPYQSFNIKQLLACGTFRVLLNIYLVSFVWWFQ